MPTLVPMVVERTSEGERSMDIFSRLGRERVIIIDTDFNPAMAATICAQLLVMDSEETKPIQLHLNTPGGEIYSLMHIFATIDKIKSPIYTFCLGLAASCGSALFNYATPGHRYISKWGTQMIHQPSSGTQGKITDQQNALQEGIRLKKVLTDLYVDKCTAKLSRKQIADLMERDKWLDAEESVRLGFADHILP